MKLIKIVNEIIEAPRIHINTTYVRQFKPNVFVEKILSAIDKQKGLATIRQNQIVQNFLKGNKTNYSTKN